jgi:transposase-like protein
MRYSASEKYEIICLVEAPSLPIRQTLRQLDIGKSAFYSWLKRYQDNGIDGLEDNAQLELLGEYGIDEIQGYLLSKPVDAQALEAILRNPLPQLGAPANVVQLRP